MLGLAERPFPAGDVTAVARVRAAILAEIRATVAAGAPDDLGRARRPARFVARRAAWHALDHAWEIQDKAPATESQGPQASGGFRGVVPRASRDKAPAT